MARIPVTHDNLRLLRLLKRLNRIPSDLEHLTGLNLAETVDGEGTAGMAMLLGSENGIDGRQPMLVPVNFERGRRPTIKTNEKGARLFHADVAETGDGFELVRQEKEGVAIRIITTGLLVSADGSTARDFASLAGKKLRYHGAFPITADAANIIGEGVELPVTAESKVLIDERFGKIKNLAGVPKVRQIGIEGVVGGPVIVGQIDGELRIHELTSEGWKTYDVTDSPHWQKKFMDLAMQDAEYLAALAADEKRREKRKKPKILKGPPPDHPDAQ